MKILIVITFLALSLAACVTGPAKTASADAEAASKTDNSSKTAVVIPRADPPLFVEFKEKCEVSGEGSTESPVLLLLAGTLLKPLVETAVPAAVGWLYDKGVHTLDQRYTKLQSSSTATGTTMYYNAAAEKSTFGCIILARAPRGVVTDGNYLATNNGTMTLPPDSRWTKDAGKTKRDVLSITRAPEFYMEIALKSSLRAELAPLQSAPPDAKAPKSKSKVAEKFSVNPPINNREKRSLYREISPATLDYLHSGAENPGNDNSKHVSLELHMDIMDGKGQWQPFYVKTYDFGKLKIGTEGINLKSFGKDIFLPPPRRTTSDGYLDPVPLRVTAVLTESEDNEDLSRTIAAALKDSQAKKKTVDAVADLVVEKLDAKIDERMGTSAASTSK